MKRKDKKKIIAVLKSLTGPLLFAPLHGLLNAVANDLYLQFPSPLVSSRLEGLANIAPPSPNSFRDDFLDALYNHILKVGFRR